MDLAKPTRRSVYADRLTAFGDFAFGDAATFERRGTWAPYFHERIGATFGGRVILEIGCFDATFLGTVAAKCPDVGFVGLDWKAKALHDASARVAGLGVRNVALLRGRGQDVRRMFAEREVDEIWVFHPDPFDRDVERQTRLLSEPFLLDVHAVLRDRGSLLALKTDHPEYFQSVRDLFNQPGAVTLNERLTIARESTDYWNDPAALAHTAERAFAGERTFFERRFIKKRQPIHYVELRRN